VKHYVTQPIYQMKQRGMSQKNLQPRVSETILSVHIHWRQCQMVQKHNYSLLTLAATQHSNRQYMLARLWFHHHMIIIGNFSWSSYIKAYGRTNRPHATVKQHTETWLLYSSLKW